MLGVAKARAEIWKRCAFDGTDGTLKGLGTYSKRDRSSLAPVHNDVVRDKVARANAPLHVACSMKYPQKAYALNKFG